MTEVARTGHLWTALEETGAINGVSLQLPQGTTFGEAVGLVGMFGEAKRRTSFYLGDLFNQLIREETVVLGENSYDDLVAASGLAEQTISNCRSTCSRVPAKVRREAVPFHIHSEVASLEPKDQAHWLKLVEQEGWSRSQLRDAMHPDQVLPPAVTDDLPSVARALVEGAKEYGSDYLITRDSFVRLRAALGDADAE